MAKLNLDILLECNTRNTQTWRLGTLDELLKDADRNKAVCQKDEEMTLAADGDEIEGFIENVETGTVDGYSYGSVIRHASGARQWVCGDGLGIGDFVVAGAQTGAGKPNTAGTHPKNSRGATVVRKGEPTTFKWRVIAISALQTNLVLIEAV